VEFYTQEHHEIQRTARKIIKDDINPYVQEWERERQFPAHEVFKKFGRAGLLGIQKPEKYGGTGLEYSYNIAMAEAVADIECGGIPMAIGVQTDMATPALARYGSEKLCNEYLVPAIAGDYVACIGVSEPGAGSDVASLKTYARRDGDDYIINGSKMWITNSLQADFMVALVNTSDGPVHHNKSLIVIPMKAPGVVRAQKLEKIGMHSSDTGLIYFEDVRVPVYHRIGEEGKGFTYQMEQFDEERLWGAANTLPSLERAIRDTIEYTRQRKIFGKSVLDNQSVHFRLAELKTEVELYRALVEKVIVKYSRGEDVRLQIAMAKLKAGRLSREVYDSCLQYWGGMGFMAESLIGRMYCDFRLTSIGGGADEVMLNIISKRMGILPKAG
jgi:citronellyl-CoA dehydrogenase